MRRPGAIAIGVATGIAVGILVSRTLLRATPQVPTVLEFSRLQFLQELREVGFGGPEVAGAARPLIWSGRVRSEADVVSLVQSVDTSAKAIASGPHADLMSAQSLIHFHVPMADSIAYYTNDSTDLWVLRQRVTLEGREWGTYGIAQDKTTTPNLAFYFQFLPGQIRFRGQTCYVCHASGPRALRPMRPDLLLGSATAEAFNRVIAQNTDVAMHFGASEPQTDPGPQLTLDACVDCHQKGGGRAPLFAVHHESVAALVASGAMPRRGALSSQQAHQIDSWVAAAWPRAPWYRLLR